MFSSTEADGCHFRGKWVSSSTFCLCGSLLYSSAAQYLTLTDKTEPEFPKISKEKHTTRQNSIQKPHITISVSADVSSLGFIASVFLLSHLRTTPPHTWPEMDGDKVIARKDFV